MLKGLQENDAVSVPGDFWAEIFQLIFAFDNSHLGDGWLRDLFKYIISLTHDFLGIIEVNNGVIDSAVEAIFSSNFPLMNVRRELSLHEIVVWIIFLNTTNFIFFCSFSIRFAENIELW